MSILCGVVIHNTPSEIVEQLLSSLSRSTVLLSIVLLCNSSDDEQNATVDRLARQYGGKALLREENRGFGAGHNTIVQRFGDGCEWYVCCNPDVVVEPQSIEILIAATHEHADAVILGPKILNVDGSVQSVHRRHPSLARWVYRQVRRVLARPLDEIPVTREGLDVVRTEFVSGCFFAIRLSHFHAIQGFSEDYFLYFEDADLSRRAEKLGRNYIVQASRVTHGWGKGWSKSSRLAALHLRNYARYLLRHGLF